MSLDRITKKPVLQGHIPQVMLPEAQTPLPPVDLPEESEEVTSMVSAYTSEIKAWQDFIAQNDENIKGLVVPLPPSIQAVLGVQELTPTLLREWRSTGDTRYPPAIQYFEKVNHVDNFNFGGMVFGMMDEVFSQLKSEFLASIGLMGNSGIRSVETERLNQVASLREKIKKSEKTAKEKLADCYTQKLISIFLSKMGKAANNLPVNLSVLASKDLSKLSLNDISSITNLVGPLGQVKTDFIKNLRNIQSLLDMVNVFDHIDWQSTRQNIEKRFYQLAQQALTRRANVLFGQLDKVLGGSVTKIIQEFQSLNTQINCGAYDQSLHLYVTELEKIRQKYLSLIVDEKEAVRRGYAYHADLVKFLDKRTDTKKQKDAIEEIIKSIEKISSTGELDMNTILKSIPDITDPVKKTNP